MVATEPGLQNVDALTRAFADARVVINAHGAFAVTGHDVAGAALAAGCHYVDTSNEQHWLVKAREVWHQQYADRGLLMVPGLAQPFTTSEIAANISLETPGAQALDILTLWTELAADSSVRWLSRVAEHHGFDARDPGTWRLDRVLNLRVPGRSEPGMAIRCDESPHEVWFRDDARVTELRAYGGAAERSALERALAEELTCGSDEGASPISHGRRVDTSIDVVYSEGHGRRTHVVMEGARPYDQTATLHAVAARYLLTEAPRRTGFASGCQAFGHRFLLDALVDAELMLPPAVTVDA
ncbi:saccharopine dehydrogenase [Nocardioides sp. JQ2195]|uniref:DUF5938 domain-containing protein n=1 Tax=Nocardioides sp. JQ2195 TaxID=2592334 RepID=UPI00143EDA0C|nr:DUF5938 domain-containing protein [Nocardioides sp. JQ2195]QIX25269.1 saccharopine dehydrogenase [Nocardioides sp. JQ2195]